MAFHLGCLRALNDRGVLEKVRVLSSVSGGSVIAALYAYFDEPFEQFEERVKSELKLGYVRGIARHTLASSETPKILATQLTAGLSAIAGSFAGAIGNGLVFAGMDRKVVSNFTEPLQAPFSRWASRTTAFERYLRKSVFGNSRVNMVQRAGLETVINATELRTGTAYRYGSRGTSCWRYGDFDGDPPFVSKAVAASAAFPALLPSFDERQSFRKNGSTAINRVIITDGGVYDNLGISCLLPGRDPNYSSSVFDVNYIISCDAGAGLPSGRMKPYTWTSRMRTTISSIHRRTHTLSYDLLHRLKASGDLKGFLLPYLGQQDTKLPYKPPDLIPRNDTYDYPTDFSPMSQKNIALLSKRGEQLTHLLIEQHNPDF